jgi:hypothetical protein
LSRGVQAARSVPWATRSAAAKNSLGSVLKTATPSLFTLPGLLGNTAQPTPAATPVGLLQ